MVAVGYWIVGKLSPIALTASLHAVPQTAQWGKSLNTKTWMLKWPTVTLHSYKRAVDIYMPLKRHKEALMWNPSTLSLLLDVPTYEFCYNWLYFWLHIWRQWYCVCFQMHVDDISMIIESIQFMLWAVVGCEAVLLSLLAYLAEGKSRWKQMEEGIAAWSHQIISKGTTSPSAEQVPP